MFPDTGDKSTMLQRPSYTLGKTHAYVSICTAYSIVLSIHLIPLSRFLFTYRSVSLSLFLPFHLSFSLCFSLHTTLSAFIIFLFYFSLSLSISFCSLSIYLSIYLSICFSFSISVSLSSPSVQSTQTLFAVGLDML